MSHPLIRVEQPAPYTFRPFCWACGQGDRRQFPACHDCGAPDYQALPAEDTDEGVYIIEAACGLVKIGYSFRSVDRRIRALEREGRQTFERLIVLPGAGERHEAWLHRAFGAFRDRATAKANGLPAYTEWFWPASALDHLVAGFTFHDAIEPEVGDLDFDPDRDR